MGAAFDVPVGSVSGELFLPESARPIHGAVASDGAFYAATGLDDESGVPASWINRRSQVVAAFPTHTAYGVLKYQAEVFSNGFLCALKESACPGPQRTLEVSARRVSESEFRLTAPANGSVLTGSTWRWVSLPSGLDHGRAFVFDIERQNDGAGLIVFGEGQSLCVRLKPANSPCLYRGRYRMSDAGPMDFELTRVDSNDRPFRGVIHVQFNEIFIGTHVILVVGSDGATGLALRAHSYWED